MHTAGGTRCTEEDLAGSPALARHHPSALAISVKPATPEIPEVPELHADAAPEVVSNATVLQPAATAAQRDAAANVTPFLAEDVKTLADLRNVVRKQRRQQQNALLVQLDALLPTNYRGQRIGSKGRSLTDVLDSTIRWVSLVRSQGNLSEGEIESGSPRKCLFHLETIRMGSTCLHALY